MNTLEPSKRKPLSRLICSTIVVSTLFVLTGCLSLNHSNASADDLPDYRYVFTYFNGESQTGLFLMGSDDGFIWNQIESEDASKPGERFSPKVGDWELFRDPSYVHGPDGNFHMVWTTGSDGIGYGWSKDITRWDPANCRYISVKRGALADYDFQHTWAPELRYDAKSEMYYIIFAARFKGATAQLPEFSKYRIQEYIMTTKDWETFSDPVPAFPRDDAISTIDGDIFPLDDGSVMLFSKIENRNRFVDMGKKTRGGIRYMRGDSIFGPWESVMSDATPMLPSAPDASEGPCAIKIGPVYLVFHDWSFGTALSYDLENWTNIRNETTQPGNWRHGTVRQLKFDTYGDGEIFQEEWTVGQDVKAISPGVFAQKGTLAAEPLPALELRAIEAPYVARGLAEQTQRRVRAILTAPETGTYQFWVSGSDQAQLWLNAEGADPAGAVMIAEDTSNPKFRMWKEDAQQHASVELKQGKRYYIELRQLSAEAAEETHASVGWTRPSQPVSDQPLSLVPYWVLSGVE